MITITKEKYKRLEEEIFTVYGEDKQKIMDIFKKVMEYDPEKSTYSREKYEKDKERILESTGGERSYYESKMRANKKYQDKIREERNRKERERYHRKKLENSKKLSEE